MVSRSMLTANGATMNRIEISVREMDEAARQLLEPIERASGYVHSSFERTINLKINGKLLAIHSRGPVGPMTCLVGQNDFQELSKRCRPGMEIAGGELPGCRRLVIADIQGQALIRLALDRIIVAPPCRIPPFPGQYDAAARAVQVIESYLKRSGDSSIFAPPGPAGSDDILVRLLRRRAWKMVRGIKSAVRASSSVLLEWQLQAAVGFGPGLTPAGDDLCYGLLASEGSLSLIGRSKFTRFQIQDLTRRIASCARANSTEFSASFLEQLGEGYLFPVVKEVLERAADSGELLKESLERLSECGHSSGFDMLAGIHLSLSMLKEGDLAFPGLITIQAGGHNNANS